MVRLPNLPATRGGAVHARRALCLQALLAGQLHQPVLRLDDLMWRKQSKAESLLDDGWTRPKGMRQRTYDGLLETLENCEERRDTAFGIRVMQLFSHQF